MQAGADLLRRVVTLGTLKHVKVHIHRCETHLGCLHGVVDVGLAGHASRRRTTPRGATQMSRWDSVDAASEGIMQSTWWTRSVRETDWAGPHALDLRMRGRASGVAARSATRRASANGVAVYAGVRHENLFAARTMWHGEVRSAEST